MNVAVRPRSRTAPVAPPKPKHEWDVPVVGGPKQAMSMGFPIYSEGHPIKVWPYTTGSRLIGYRLAEYQTKARERVFYAGGDNVLVKVHAWQFRNGELRYLGGFDDKDRAVGQVALAYKRGSAPTPPVQRVATRVRARPVQK